MINYELFSYGLALAMGLLAWVSKTLFSTMKEKMETLEQQNEEIKKELAQVKVDYVHKTDFMAIKNEILQRFDRFEDRLNNLKI